MTSVTHLWNQRSEFFHLNVFVFGCFQFFLRSSEFVWNFLNSFSQLKHKIVYVTTTKGHRKTNDPDKFNESNGWRTQQFERTQPCAQTSEMSCSTSDLSSKHLLHTGHAGSLFKLSSNFLMKRSNTSCEPTSWLFRLKNKSLFKIAQHLTVSEDITSTKYSLILVSQRVYPVCNP